MGLLQALLLDVLKRHFPPLQDTLRLELLRGNVKLTDVHIPPSKTPISHLSLPLLLTRASVASLTLHVPWTSLRTSSIRLEAREILIHLSEPTFPNDAHHVFDALTNAASARKQRALAGAESEQTSFARLFHSLLPSFANHFELVLYDIVIHISFADQTSAIIRLDSLKMTPSPAGSPRPTLSNNLTITSLSISIYPPPVPARPALLRLECPAASLSLVCTNAEYHINFSLSNVFSLCIHPDLLPFFQRARRRIARWNFAHACARPESSVRENARDWWKYAYRCILSRRRPHTAFIPPSRARRAARCAVEYKRLHVRRLRRGVVLGASEKDRLYELEESLHEDMILLAREQARKDVISDDVSAFATDDWLCWLFFNHQMSSEREKLAGEIRQSLAMAQGEVGEEGGGVAWGRLDVLICLDEFVLEVMGVGDGISARVCGMRVSAEAGASFETFGVTVCVRDVSIAVARREICGRGRFSDGDFVQRGACDVTEPVFEAKLERRGKEEVIKASVNLQPVSFIVDVFSVASFMQLVPLLSETSRVWKNDQASAGVASMTWTDFVSNVMVVANAPYVALALSEGSSSSTDVSSPRVIAVVLHDVSADVKMVDEALLISSRALLSVMECSELSDVSLPLEKKQKCWNMADVSPNQSFGLSCRFDVHCGEDGVDVNLHEVDAFSTLSYFHPPFRMVTRLVELLQHRCEAKCHEIEGGKDPPALSVHEKRSAPYPEFRIIASTVTFILKKQDWSNRVFDIFLLKAANLQFKMNGSSNLFVTLQEFRLTEESHGATVHVTHSGQARNGLSLVAKNSQHKATNMVREIEVTLGTVDVFTKPQSAAELQKHLRYYQRVFDSGNVFSEAANHAGRSRIKPCSSNCSSTASIIRGSVLNAVRISTVIQSMNLECVSDISQMRMKCKSAFFVQQGVTLNGSLDGIKVTDLSANSGRYSNVFKHMDCSSSPIPPDVRALSFTVGPQSTNIHLSSIRVIIQRTFIYQFTRLITSFRDAFGVVGDNGSAGMNFENANSSKQSMSSNMITIQAFKTYVLCPASPHDSEAAYLEIPYITATLSHNSKVLCFRKLSLLTKPSSARLVPSDDPASSSVLPSSDLSQQWAVLIRSIDLDVSYHCKATMMLPDLSKTVNSEWNINILSRAALFLTPSEVKTVRVVYGRLFPAREEAIERSNEKASNADVCNAEQNQKSTSTQLPHPILSLFHHTVLHLETHAISVELLKDGHDGRVVSSIACLELDPIRLSLKSASKEGDSHQVHVSNWRLRCPSLRLEDRSLNTPSFRQSAIETSESWIGAHARTGNVPEPDRLKMGLFVEGITRVEESKNADSSYTISLENARFIVSPSMYLSIGEFIYHCSISNRQEGTEDNIPSSAVPKVHKGRNYAERVVREEDELLPSMKISVCFVNPIISMFGTGAILSESSVDILLTHVKMTLLYSRTDNLLKGSCLKVKGVKVSMNWVEKDSVENESEGTEGTKDDSRHGLRNSFGNTFPRLFTSGQDVTLNDDQPRHRRHSIAVVSKRVIGTDETEPQSQAWASKPFMHIKSVSVRFPTTKENQFSILVPSLSVDTSSDSLMKFLTLASVLDILPPFDEDAEICVPKIQISAKNVAARIKVPTTTNPVSTIGKQSSRYCSILRAQASATVVLTENVEKMSGKVKTSADVLDEERGIYDQLLSPSSVNFNVIIGDTMVVNISAESLVRIALSPLTIRTGAGLFFRMMEGEHQNLEARHEKEVIVEDGMIRTTGVGVSGMQIGVVLHGLVIQCISEQPRMQILRLVFWEIKGMCIIPTSREQQGQLYFSLGNVMLEDTISWQLYRSSREDFESQQWTTNVIVGNRNVHRSEEIVGMSSMLDRAVHRLLLLSGDGKYGQGEKGNGRVMMDKWWHAGSQRENEHVCRIVGTWQWPLEHVAVHIDVSGLDLNVDMAIAPSLIAWGISISREVSDVESAQKECREYDWGNMNNKEEKQGFIHVGIDHMVLESIQVKFGIRAPPQRLKQSISQRAMSWILGAELASGICITLPRVIFNGDFRGIQGVAERLERMYFQALMSQTVLKQVALQAGLVCRVGRVFATSMLRRREYVPLAIEQGRNIAVESREGGKGMAEKSRGLLDAINEYEVRVGRRERNVLTGRSEGVGSVETVDITQTKGMKQL